MSRLDSREEQVLQLAERSAQLWPAIDQAMMHLRREKGRPLTLEDIRELDPVQEFYGLSEQFLALMGEAQP